MHEILIELVQPRLSQVTLVTIFLTSIATEK